ncbi:hypothetical protein Rsub_11600 [Raphidocelis subcapitata]|uniref:Malectin-like domain-containing protein n=1 Tax=Raphidocelis subcapitata TaxID=307507 RepID=A0A2V0PNV4_9CHLO|nr:hypothetical protein Rsub_11600 [Raphidocelis subcapitata]|eukprot:GBF98835.1 hypothetical protein Rsub_11600 [Raphidocelis subcapitata]
MAAGTAPRGGYALALLLALALALAGTARADGPSDDPDLASNVYMEEAGPHSWSSDPSGPLDVNTFAPAASTSATNPFRWWTDWFVPDPPAVGVKRTFTLWIVNVADRVIPQGTVVSFWANKTIPDTPCRGAVDADINYKLPELKPLYTYALKVAIPYSSKLTPYARARMALFLDSECTAYDFSNQIQQRNLSQTVLPKDANNSNPGVALYDPNEYPSGTTPVPKGIYLQVWPELGNVDTSRCNDNKDGVSVELPQIAGGQIKM